MNPLLSVLAPPEEHRAIQARLAEVLECSRHELLQASADVWEPGETPEPKPPPKRIRPKQPRKVRADTNASGKTHRAQMLLALSDTPQTYRELAVATGLPVHVVRNTLGNLGTLGLVANLATSGAHGKYVLPPVERPKVKREVFDV